MEQELRMLLKRPGNDACADCGGRYPRFASVSLGIFLCNRCYGIHRSIGTHITRTKTVGLDRWSADEVHRMRSIGNVVANSFWEENGPPIFQRPTADSPGFEVEKWIRDKYERKLFCSPDKEPPSVPPQVSEPVNPDYSVGSPSPRVKLLPRGTLRCGPDCLAPSPRQPQESMSCTSTPRDDFFSQLRSPRPGQHRTSGSGATLQAEHAYGEALEFGSGTQPEPIYDDEDFGDFVQATKLSRQKSRLTKVKWNRVRMDLRKRRCSFARTCVHDRLELDFQDGRTLDSSSAVSFREPDEMNAGYDIAYVYDVRSGHICQEVFV